MRSTVGIIVRCGAIPRLLLSSLRSLAAQSIPPAGVVLVTDPATPPGAREWINCLGSARQFPVVASASALPGAVANAGLQHTGGTAIIVLDAGDALAPTAIETVARFFEMEHNSGFALTGVRVLGPGPKSVVHLPPGHDAFTVATSPDCAPPGTPIRRTALEAVGGFSEDLPALESADLVLRMLAADWAGATISEPLLVRCADSQAAWQVTRDPDLRGAAMEGLVSRHITVLAADPATALHMQEAELQILAGRYRAAVTFRDKGVAELERLRARSQALLMQLPDDARSTVNLGDLHRTTPVSRNWGYERGVPIDRYYVERFLQGHATDIHGVVLEVQESDYTRRFGGDQVTRSDVLDLDPGNSRATIVADLRDAPNIPDTTYDCLIVTQTLHVIDDMRRVVEECARILSPGGVLLATLPCASRVCLEYGRDGDFWRVTEAGARALFDPVFGGENVTANAHGNVLTSAAFQFGLACHEIAPAELETDDPYNPLLVTVRAKKAGSASGRRPAGVALSRNAGGEGVGVVLLYHRVARAHHDIHALSVPPELFDEQMAYVAGRCTPVTLETVALSGSQHALPPRAVAVTFDDGYADDFAETSQKLWARGVSATVFMTTAQIRTNTAFYYWWDVLEQAVLGDGEGRATLSLPLQDGVCTFATRTRADRIAAHRAIHAAIVSFSREQRESVIAAVVRERPGAYANLPRRMTLAELRSLAAQPGIEIGAHTEHHLALPGHPLDRQRDEILASRRTLESLLQRPIRTFAYPYGAWSPATATLVAEAGFIGAVTCDEGPVHTRSNPFSLPRLEVKATTVDAFAAALERAFTGTPSGG
jgi:peptidoglycan/xylan/chitin deacetylase (PgdA/CDA1 family)/SAM-dependent methyltransferase